MNKVAMCPPELSPPADNALDGSDEQVISYLDGFKPGSLLPKNVLDDINPFQYRPSCLPDGIWFIVNSTEKKENEYGFWEVKEEASEVFSNSSMSGWRTTLEYFEFVDYPERRTDWMMQEYKITQKGKCDANKEKELRTMCRIFLSTAMRSNKGEHPKSKAAGNEGMNDSPTVPLIASSIDSSFGKDSTSGSLMKTAVDGTTLSSKDDKFLDHQQRDISGLYPMFSDDDYLELDDIADPLSHFSSSDNSGRTSMTSDEYFDPNALLQALEGNSNQGQQGRDSSSRCNVTASIRSEVVVQPATSRPLVCGTVRQQPSRCNQASSTIETKFLNEKLVNHSVKKLKADQRDEDPSFSRGVGVSSSPATPIPNEKKDAVVKTKRLKKYICFLPF